MRLSYRDLKKRDVINVEDGRCLGRIIDIDLRFPDGVLTGIIVPGRRVYGFRLFDRTEIYIDERRIIKIGGDVILVNVNCGDNCAPNVRPKSKGNSQGQGRPNKNCPPPCSPVCPPPCSPNEGNKPTCEQLFGEDFGDEY